MSSLHLPLPAVRRLAAVLLLMVSVGPPALAGEARGTANLEAQLAAPDPRVLKRVTALREAEPEAGIRDLYAAYERVAEQSGHDLDLRLSSFETIGIDDFSRYRWLDLLSTSTGMQLYQSRDYYEAPWVDGDRVYYDLSWKPRSASSEATAQKILEQWRNVTIAEAIVALAKMGHMTDLPLAVTTYRVRVSMAGRSRTYRAAAFWYEGQEGDFTLSIQDRVVEQVDSAVGETAVVVTKDEYDDLLTGRPPTFAAEGRPPRKPCDPKVDE